MVVLLCLQFHYEVTIFLYYAVLCFTCSCIIVLYLDVCFILRTIWPFFAAIYGYPTVKCFVICIKDRLPDRHSCLNLHPCLMKFSQSVSLNLSVCLCLPICLCVSLLLLSFFYLTSVHTIRHLKILSMFLFFFVFFSSVLQCVYVCCFQCYAPLMSVCPSVFAWSSVCLFVRLSVSVCSSLSLSLSLCLSLFLSLFLFLSVVLWSLPVTLLLSFSLSFFYLTPVHTMVILDRS